MRFASLIPAPLRLAALLALPLLAARPAGDVCSLTMIPPGKQFVLGGGQRGAFAVVADNIGSVPVEIRERPVGGGIFGKAVLQPGQKGKLQFLTGSTAVVLNPSRREASLCFVVTGDRNLGMGYEPVQKTILPADTVLAGQPTDQK